MVQEEVDRRLVESKVHRVELKQQGIRAGMKVAESVVADEAIAKFFYANAISFSAADCSPGSPFRKMIASIHAAGPGYVPPGRGSLGGPLIDSCDAQVAHEIKMRDPDGVLAARFGRAYTSDGWDSCDNLPLINSAYITANDGGVYLRSVDTSGFTKNAEYIASLIICDIYTIGCTTVCLELTDTCAVMQKAWAFVEDEFPWLSSGPCQTHCPSLLLADISKISEVASTLKDESTVVTW